jgi:hypothetical protein
MCRCRSQPGMQKHAHLTYGAYGGGSVRQFLIMIARHTSHINPVACNLRACCQARACAAEQFTVYVRKKGSKEPTRPGQNSAHTRHGTKRLCVLCGCSKMWLACSREEQQHQPTARQHQQWRGQCTTVGQALPRRTAICKVLTCTHV